METWRTRRERVFAAAVGVFVSLGAPARALAQATGDAGPSGWGLPDESAPPEAPTEPSPSDRRQEKSAPPPPADQPASPPAGPAEPAEPRRAKPPLGPLVVVTVTSDAASVEIRGPGIEKPLQCSAPCTLRLHHGAHFLDIRDSGRNWTMPVAVTGPERVIVDAPSSSARGIGIAAIIVGGSILSGFLFGSLVIESYCTDNGYDGTEGCPTHEKATPYFLAALGVGVGVTATGIVLTVGNNKPSVEIVPAVTGRARRTPGTFVGLGPVKGEALPGFSLRASF